ncbi:MAG: SufS family cysteine desulfurase [Bacteroidales bacterium]|nr:SufS family cysteine desulfurase [Bacteroidales bacterium]
MKSIDDIRAQFPQLQRTVYGKPLVYLDNAATSLRPASVIERWTRSAASQSANLHRAVHCVAVEATEAYEQARDAVRDFINAPEREEVIFTSGTTPAINLAAFSIGEAFIGEGDEVIVAESEHHSNIVPWQLMCSRRGATLRTLPVDDTGHLQVDLLPSLISPRTKLVCVAHISNVLGLVNPVRRIADICRQRGVMLLVDGAQGIVHQNVDVQALGCDFYAFSGHKMYGAPGTGVLWGRRALLEQMPPMFGGGEMIQTVSWSGSTWAPLPAKFEAGTQDISAVPCWVPAIEVLKEMPQDDALRDYIYDALTSIDGLTLYGRSSEPSEKVPLFSFAVQGVHHEDLALILDKMGIAVRSGQMCAEPLMDRFGVTGMLRASFAPYNTMQEAEYFVSSLLKAIKMLQ